MLLTTHTLFDKCYGRYAIPAVNVFFMEEILALFAAAQASKSPFIVQTTPFARDYVNKCCFLLFGYVQLAALHLHKLQLRLSQQIVHK